MMTKVQIYPREREEIMGEDITGGLVVTLAQLTQYEVIHRTEDVEQVEAASLSVYRLFLPDEDVDRYQEHLAQKRQKGRYNFLLSNIPKEIVRHDLEEMVQVARVAKETLGSSTCDPFLVLKSWSTVVPASKRVTIHPKFIENSIRGASIRRLCLMYCAISVFPFRWNLNQPDAVDSAKSELYSLLYQRLQQIDRIKAILDTFEASRIKESPYVTQELPQKRQASPLETSATEASIDRSATKLSDLVGMPVIPVSQSPLFKRYRLTHVLGHGAYGIVFRARSTTDTSDLFAIKLQNVELDEAAAMDKTRDPRYAPSYLELRVLIELTKLLYPKRIEERLAHFTKVFDWAKIRINLVDDIPPLLKDNSKEARAHLLDFEDGISKERQRFKLPRSLESNYQAIVTEYIDGGDVYRLLDKNPTLFFSLRYFSAFMMQVVASLQELQAHLLFVHFDFKPDNILLKTLDAQNHKNGYLVYELSPLDGEHGLSIRPGTFYVPSRHTNGQIVVLNDFGLSYIEISGSKHKDDEDIKLHNDFVQYRDEGVVDAFNPSFDLHKLSCHLIAELYRNAINGVIRFEDVSEDILAFLRRLVHLRWKDETREEHARFVREKLSHHWAGGASHPRRGEREMERHAKTMIEYCDDLSKSSYYYRPEDGDPIPLTLLMGERLFEPFRRRPDDFTSKNSTTVNKVNPIYSPSANVRSRVAFGRIIKTLTKINPASIGLPSKRSRRM